MSDATAQELAEKVRGPHTIGPTCPCCDALAELVRRAEQADRYKEALEQIASVDPDDWHDGDGWTCVEFIRSVTRAVLAPAERQEPT
jgi:hypothetical protein